MILHELNPGMLWIQQCENHLGRLGLPAQSTQRLGGADVVGLLQHGPTGDFGLKVNNDSEVTWTAATRVQEPRWITTFKE